MQPASISFSRLLKPTDVSELLPPADSPFSSDDEAMATEWMRQGLRREGFSPRPGIQSDAAIRHCATILRANSIPSELRVRAVAMLIRQWFMGYQGTHALAA